jgi:hypothetical protein
MFFQLSAKHLDARESRVPVCFADRPLGRGLEEECAGDAHFSFPSSGGSSPGKKLGRKIKARIMKATHSRPITIDTAAFLSGLS